MKSTEIFPTAKWLEWCALVTRIQSDPIDCISSGWVLFLHVCTVYEQNWSALHVSWWAFSQAGSLSHVSAPYNGKALSQSPPRRTNASAATLRDVPPPHLLAVVNEHRWPALQSRQYAGHVNAGACPGGYSVTNTRASRVTSKTLSQSPRGQARASAATLPTP